MQSAGVNHDQASHRIMALIVFNPFHIENFLGYLVPVVYNFRGSAAV